MFSDRGRLLKILVPLALFAGLCADAAWRIGAVRPTLEEAAAHPERYDGFDIWISPTRVVEAAPDGFVIEEDDVRLKLLTAERPEIGTHVMARGIFRKDGTLAVSKMHVSRNWKVQRGGIYGISAVVLAVFAFALLRRFRLGRGGIRPREPAGGEGGPEGNG